MAFYGNLNSPWSGVIKGDSPPGQGWIDLATPEGQKLLNSKDAGVIRNQLGSGQDGLGQGFDPSEAAPVLNPSAVQPQPSQPSQPQLPPVQNQQPVIPQGPLSLPETPVNQATAPSDISQFIPGTSTQQQDIINQAIQQSRGVANTNVDDLSKLFHDNIIAQMKNWTDPNSPDYQATMGQLNNVGRADQNTFGQALSSRLAPLMADSMTKLGQGALLPSFEAQQGLVGSGAGTQSNLGLSSLQRFMNQQDFQKQAELANQLADKGQPSNFQQAAGGTSSLLGGLGGFFQGLPGLKQVSDSWICSHLKKLGLATEEEIEDVHKRLDITIFRHPIYWLHYLYCAPRLIDEADRQGIDWKEVKPILIDAVLAEPDSEKAWQIYRAECQRLTLAYAPHLWTLEIA